ncbi:energy transducer TonB [Lewinella sp. W8]|uniref:energy transducer TonB n=1 Tax=Lewinella sp. W8 TaxID=2528208 RepID=UPI001068A5D6|nr:energy transducer TonB [Lewinella sp. W8]MTB53601.1 TonB family protein [Lewinella sp. W8]
MLPARSPYLRLSLFLSLFCSTFAVGYYASTPTVVESPPYACKLYLNRPVEVPGREIHQLVDQMPVFPGAGCRSLSFYDDRKECGEQALMEYVYSHLEYPKTARQNAVTGVAVVSFVVEPDGTLSTIRVLRDPGAGTGEAAAEVIRRMQKDNLRWEPGLLDGRDVRVRFNLPVRFDLR